MIHWIFIFTLRKIIQKLFSPLPLLIYFEFYNTLRSELMNVNDHEFNYQTIIVASYKTCNNSHGELISWNFYLRVLRAGPLLLTILSFTVLYLGIYNIYIYINMYILACLFIYLFVCIRQTAKLIGFKFFCGNPGPGEGIIVSGKNVDFYDLL